MSDPLAPLRELFETAQLDATGTIYLDGNSLGLLPRATSRRVQHVVSEEWGHGLIRSWNDAGWITLAQRVADKLAPLVGARSGEVVVSDSTSVNLFKVLSAAIALAPQESGRRHIVSERSNFPSDLYIADTLARAHGYTLTLLSDEDAIAPHLGDRLAVLLLTHVNYRTGRMHDLGGLTRSAHRGGGLVVWDLAHSAGAVPVDLHGEDEESAADFAVGCGYKYLNGGPGAPAFAWAHPRHTARMDATQWRPPLAGWFGHATPFDFAADYQPSVGMSRFLCGTPPVLSLAALECGVDSVRAADVLGGIAAVREKSVALTELFITLVESTGLIGELTLASPRHAAERGSQVALAHPTGGYAIMQALIARGVIGDFRAPDLLRFGFTPLYTRFVDVWDAVDRLRQVLTSGEWQQARFAVRHQVT